MRVLKFGGTSVANAERFLRVADILESNARQGQVATVLSAPAKITNHLVAMIEKTIGGQDALPNIADAERIFAELLQGIVEGKREEALMVHTAGSIPMNVWEGHVPHYGVFYPMQTFSKQREVDFKEIPFFIEASSAEDAAFLKAIASTLSNRVYDADSEQRKSLHLAAVFTCNFTNHMYALAAELLKKYNLPFDVMLPLIDETARKVHELEPKTAQTGPAIRYDENVIGNHLRMLADDPAMQRLYELLSRSIHERQ